MAAGLLLAVVALFMAPMSLRELCVHFNRSDFVSDELHLEEFRPSGGGHSSDWLVGHVVSSGSLSEPIEQTSSAWIGCATCVERAR